jgi:carboxypeptidase A4
MVSRFNHLKLSLTAPGFVYTQTTDRLWRKNRQTLSSSSCVGRDVNRNWPYQWMFQVEHLPILVTTLAKVCFPVVISESPLIIIQSETAGDATENAVLRNYLDNLAAGQSVQLYIDIHPYS